MPSWFTPDEHAMNDDPGTIAEAMAVKVKL